MAAGHLMFARMLSRFGALAAARTAFAAGVGATAYSTHFSQSQPAVQVQEYDTMFSLAQETSIAGKTGK